MRKHIGRGTIGDWFDLKFFDILSYEYKYWYNLIGHYDSVPLSIPTLWIYDGRHNFIEHDFRHKVFLN